MKLYAIIPIVALTLASCVTDDSVIESTVKIGDKVPDFIVELNNGTLLASDDLIGRHSVITFFNTSCSDCQRELPVIDSLYRRRPELIVACIARSESAQSIAEYWEANNLTVPYSAQPDASVYNLFATAGIPRIYIIDESQTVVAQFDDTYTTLSMLESALNF